MGENVSRFRVWREARRVGRRRASTAIPATASTACSARSTAIARPAFEFVQARHEEMAAFMAARTRSSPARSACAWRPPAPARSTCSTASTTPRWTTSRCVAIVGQQARDGARRRLPAGGRPAIAVQGRRARVRAHVPSTPEQVRHLVDRAIRIARAERTVTCVILPNDVQEMDAVEAPPHAHGTVHSGVGYVAPRVVPRRRGSATRRRRSSTPASRSRSWSGAGALGAPRRGHRGRRRCSAPASPRRCSGKAVLPDDLPVRDRRDRAARHQAELGPDDRTATRC